MTADEDGGVGGREAAGEHSGDARAAGRSAPRSLVRPDAREAADLVAAGLDGAALVAVAGRCTVSYRGRASSDAPAGTRHLLLKPDGTVLVHDRDGHRPVNWQPPGSDVVCRVADAERGGESRVRDGEEREGGEDRGDIEERADEREHEDGRVGTDGSERLVVESRRRSPDERLVVRFSSIDHAAVLPVERAPAPEVAGTEADLKERVLESPELVESGFTPLATERDTPAGAVDVFGTDDRGRTVVLELKRRRAGTDAVGQLDRYVTALRRDLHADAEIRGILVAPSVTERASALLEEERLEFVALRPRPE